jgi:hypothetical protein
VHSHTNTGQSTNNLLPPNNIYIYMSYHTVDLQALYFIYLFNKYPY